ncbi:virulence associated protein D (vapD) [Helicobacter pylori]|uniref:Endoribonuclease VapD n=1 Tax=Helicobacter pylori TaxID=210 RepID=A0A649Z3N6_HELPX|nr:virulence associated protein D (vapD) [Helicobacter pylori]MCQ2758110.1 virulence associated protein D (vapD) [Helicobacter pylori]QGM49690.1 putative virulence-associated protein D [Helicobacter pylori]GHQ60697.1 endoribonuclease VapD [Helicobacter pylori]GHR32556.1 endoribonuclease VapD [Helicobacter pylori]
MYAISFDLDTNILKQVYSVSSPNNAYGEVRQILGTLGFQGIQGSVYVNLSVENNLTQVYKAINKLSQIQWFKQAVKDIRAFKVEDWSDFTEIVKSQNLL